MVKRYDFYDGERYDYDDGEYVTYDDYEKLEKQLAELREKLRWIPVTERLPKTDKYYEAKFHDDVYLSLHIGDGFFICGDAPDNYQAGFWREMPELEDGVISI